jgi:hypothetical protein
VFIISLFFILNGNFILHFCNLCLFSFKLQHREGMLVMNICCRYMLPTAGRNLLEYFYFPNFLFFAMLQQSMTLLHGTLVKVIQYIAYNYSRFKEFPKRIV